MKEKYIYIYELIDATIANTMMDKITRLSL